MFINLFIFLMSSGKVLQVGSIKMFNLSSLLLSILLVVGLLLTACGQQSTVPQENIVEESDSPLAQSIDRGRTDDLVIGVPGEGIGDIGDAGAINVLFGTSLGLSNYGNEFWHQGSRNIRGRAEHNDYFGNTLAIGDFDGDRRDDVAIGVPNNVVSSIEDAGAVNVLYGFRGGLKARDNQIWTENTRGIRGLAELGDNFGEVLAVGDFNGDSKDDLAIGTPSEDIGNLYATSGAVHILYGSNIGLTARGDQLWHQGNIGLTTNEVGDSFGSALTAGDFNGDGKDDLAISVPNKDLNDVRNAGIVIILQGSPSGLTAVGSTLWHQDSADVYNEAEYFDLFGFTLAANDFNGDGKDDLAVGVPYEDFNSNIETDEGMVHILLGSDNGITARGNYGLYGSGDINDRFGKVLTSGNYNGDKFYDLAVGAPDQSVGNIPRAGRVVVYYGMIYGPSALGQFFDQNTVGIQDASEEGDRFGAALASGDFNGDGKDDLAIGVPDEALTINTLLRDVGAVNVLYGSDEGITAAFNQFWHQDYVKDTPEESDYFGSALASRK